MSAEANAARAAEIVREVRSQNWKNGGVLTLDVRDAEELVAAAVDEARRDGALTMRAAAGLEILNLGRKFIPASKVDEVFERFMTLPLPGDDTPSPAAQPKAPEPRENWPPINMHTGRPCDHSYVRFPSTNNPICALCGNSHAEIDRRAKEEAAQPEPVTPAKEGEP